MAAMRFEQVQRFILARKIFWGEVHFKSVLISAICKQCAVCSYHTPKGKEKKRRLKFELQDYVAMKINKMRKGNAPLNLSKCASWSNCRT